MLAVTQQAKRPPVPSQYEAAQVRHTKPVCCAASVFCSRRHHARFSALSSIQRLEGRLSARWLPHRSCFPSASLPAAAGRHVQRVRRLGGAHAALLGGEAGAPAQF